MAVDSPLRRSGVFSPATPVRSVQTNDDEAEREARRSTASTISPESASDNANLNLYLQMYSDNKFNKDNAWDVNVIDHFSNMLAKHHKAMTNFQVVGSSLEASAKVYVLRVDSLHTDTMRMASELSRQSSKKARNAENDDEDDDNENDQSAANEDPQQPKEKKKRQRRHVATVTKNKETLNAKLDTNPFTDPFFAQLNSIVGDINASSRLMQNLIPSRDGELRLRQDFPFWDPSPHPEMLYNDDENYEDAVFHTVNLKSDLISNAFALHQRLKGYRITNTPVEDDEDHDTDLDRSLNVSNQAAAVVFDPNAEVQQITQLENDYVMDYDADFGGAADDAGFEELTQDERVAIEGCKNLRRQPVVIEDMRPVDSQSSQLEYSYRPLDMISQFWAGPSHWKYRRLRSSVQQKKSLAATDAASEVGAPKRRGPRKKTFALTTVEDFLNYTDSNDLFLVKDPKKPLKNITYSKMYIHRNWNPKKLKLPTKLDLEKNMFTRLTCAPNLHLAPAEPNEEPEIPVEAYNYDNNQDREYCSHQNIETDAETDTDFGGEPEPINTSDENILPEMGPVNQTLDFISTEFAGAPEKVEKILISYAKRAKPVDMKQLKSGCWKLVNDLTGKPPMPPSKDEEPMEVQAILHFKDIYDHLPEVISKTMAENMSIGLVFYSMLHLANEKGIQLQMQSDLEDFTILLPEEK